MKFIWDESKRIGNLNKRDLDFALTYLVFEHDTFTFEDNRITYITSDVLSHWDC